MKYYCPHFDVKGCIYKGDEDCCLLKRRYEFFDCKPLTKFEYLMKKTLEDNK